ncbi:MAG: bifunctional 2',3'-cyclic-nucleotide 2'-phosphodiesterase/3'-nucleotidase [Cellulosilyticaceae bacterium]
MKYKLKKILLSVWGLCCLPLVFGACSKAPAEPEVVTTPAGEHISEIKILATSDMHDYLMNYDYYTTSESDAYGLVKLSTIIKDFRAKSEGLNNIVLLDNGDLIQGNPLGDYFARVEPVKVGEKHPIYKAFEAVGYDAAGLGNHEFNYGLDYLQQIIKDTTIPVVNANIYNAETNENEFKPYAILDKIVAGPNGAQLEIQVGVISFVPTQIMNWDKLYLEGKVTVQDIKKSAEEFIPKMKAEGADIIVALAHTGYGSDGDYIEGVENMAYHLTNVEGIDVVIGGHSHEMFPTEGFAERTGYKNVDTVKGTINDTFTVQPPKYAGGLGVVTLGVVPEGDTYKVVDGKSEVIMAKGVLNDPELQQLLEPDHQKVIEYVNGPVGKTTAPVTSFFSLVTDDASVQIVSDAQIDYAQKAVRDAAELQGYKELPILSAAAPFKAGLSKGGTNPEDYVNIPAGDIAIKDVTNLYKYPNTVTILKLKGKDIKEWLEMTSGMFNTINPNSTEKQPLLNESFPSFNFDTLDGVTYEIDVTQTPRYDNDGNLMNQESYRIKNLQYKGQDVTDEQEFLVITNNYRGGGGGNFPIFSEDTTPVVYSSSDETRQVVADYIKNKGTIEPVADGNWKLAPIEGEAQAVFLSNGEATQYLEKYTSIVKGEDKGNGLAEYIYTFK